MFICPTCGRLNTQNNPTVDEETVMFCYNYDKHSNRQSRIMRILSKEESA